MRTKCTSNVREPSQDTQENKFRSPNPTISLASRKKKKKNFTPMNNPVMLDIENSGPILPLKGGHLGGNPSY